jgi:very-short-patch-repair endonuclease
MTPAEQLEQERRRAQREKLEKTFRLQLMASKLYEGWIQEHRFHPVRKWSLDFARPDIKLAVEIEGGTFTGGRHTRGKGYEEDCEKYNALTAMGWTLFRFTSRMVTSGKAILFVEDFLKGNASWQKP